MYETFVLNKFLYCVDRHNIGQLKKSISQHPLPSCGLSCGTASNLPSSMHIPCQVSLYPEIPLYNITMSSFFKFTGMSALIK